MTPNAKDFPALIRWLADTYHEGAVVHVGESVGISQATAHKWVNGRATPTLPKVIALCDGYKLDLPRVIEMVKNTKPPKLRGMLVGLVVSLVLVGSVPAPAEPLPVDARLRELHITSWSASSRKLRAWLIHLWVCVLPRLDLARA